MSKLNTSALLLLGGRSLRMGSDKAMLRIGDQTFLGRIAHKLAMLTDDLVIVGPHTTAYVEAVSPLPVRFVADVFANCGPLGGLHAGLQAIQNPSAIVVACDMPLVNVDLLKYMAGLLGAYDAVVPQDVGGWHPLHAVYHQRCVTRIEDMLNAGDAGDLRMQSLIKHLNVHTLKPEEMRHFDPHGLSLKNVNTPTELAALGALQ